MGFAYLAEVVELDFLEDLWPRKVPRLFGDDLDGVVLLGEVVPASLDPAVAALAQDLAGQAVGVGEVSHAQRLAQTLLFLFDSS